MPEHSPEPWRAHEALPEHSVPWRILALDKNIATVCEEDEAEANAQRIVACVNACQQIPTDSLKMVVDPATNTRLAILTKYPATPPTSTTPVPCNRCGCDIAPGRNDRLCGFCRLAVRTSHPDNDSPPSQ